MFNTYSRYITCISLTAALLLTGCGYSISKGGSAVKPASGGSRVSVQMFVNETFEPLVEKELTSALKDQIAIDGRWRLTDTTDADLSVTGRVTNFELLPLSYDAKERIQEYRVRIKSDIKVTDIKTGTVVWKGANIETFSDYRLTRDITKNKINHSEAVKNASKKLADDFIIRVLDSF